MPLYSYSAKSGSGESVSGEVHAMSLGEARGEIAKMDLHIEEVHEAEIEDSSAPLSPAQTNTAKEERSYLPLHETLRLYAGWLLAWYALVYALGSYQHLRPLPFRFPLAEGLFLSPLVRSFTLAAFLYLLLGNVHERFGGGVKKGLLMCVIGVLIFSWYGMNVA